MADEPIQAPDGAVGTTGAPPPAGGTSDPAPPVQDGRAPGSDPTADGRATAPDAEFDLGVDPKTLPPELQGLWDQTHKQMKSTFTRKMQELGTTREKVAAYDAFMSDPVGQLQALAAQYGLSISRREAAQAMQQQGGNAQAEWDGQGDPPSWDAVLNRAKSVAREELMAEFGPVLQNVRSLQAKSVEQQLTSIDPDWKMYESDMRQLLQSHPSLANDIPRLYRLALPEEVVRDRALKEAQARLNASAGAARMGSTHTKTSQPAPKKVESFEDAVEVARRKIKMGASGG